MWDYRTAIGRSDKLLHANRKHQASQVVGSWQVHCVDAFRTGSSNLSCPPWKLAHVHLSYSGHVTSSGMWTVKHIPQGSCWEVFESSWWKSNGRKLFCGENWWSPENIYNSIVNYVSGCWISYDAQILSLGLKSTYFKCNMVCPFVPKIVTANWLEFALQMSTFLCCYFRSHLYLRVFTFSVKHMIYFWYV